MSAPVSAAPVSPATEHDEIAELWAEINRLEVKLEAAEQAGAKYNDPAVLIMRQQQTAMLQQQTALHQEKNLLIKAQQREAAEAGTSQTQSRTGKLRLRHAAAGRNRSGSGSVAAGRRG
jgi:hypothetical protein